MSRLSCEAVTSAYCENTPGAGGDERLVACYRCGLGVCRACSSIQPASVLARIPGEDEALRMVYRRVRLCDGCLEYEDDGEAKVLLRRYHEAGYPEKTLAECGAEVDAQYAYRAARSSAMKMTEAAGGFPATQARPVRTSALPNRRRLTGATR